MKHIPIAVLGATGAVGQTFVRLLESHPQFIVHELLASEKSAGKKYREACHWLAADFPSERIAELVVKAPGDKIESQLLFSGLSSSVAPALEREYRERGHLIISNASAYRMDESVPLLIPEINMPHLGLLSHQKGKGKIITNSNCVVMFLALVLHPLHQAFGISAVHVSTLQSISGAGYPGVASLDILGNVIPYIPSDEEKIEKEINKILGNYTEKSGIIPADFGISAHCHRVAVSDGHLASLSIKLESPATVADIKSELAHFIGFPQKENLYSAPPLPIIVREEIDRPQPRKDIYVNGAMSAVVGRIRPCPLYDIKFSVVGHNMVRGAAGAAILNAEAYLAAGYTFS